MPAGPGSTAARYGGLGEIAWYADNSGDRIHDVGGKLPNAWGLHDTIGDVWEWCFDRYDPEVYGDYRVLRGAGWSARNGAAVRVCDAATQTSRSKTSVFAWRARPNCRTGLCQHDPYLLRPRPHSYAPVRASRCRHGRFGLRSPAHPAASRRCAVAATSRSSQRSMAAPAFGLNPVLVR